MCKLFLSLLSNMDRAIYIQVSPSLAQLQPSHHQVTHIVEVKFRDALPTELRETLFLSVFGCPCCPQKKEWLSKESLVCYFGVNEDKINEIEISAEKERKERETRRNALAI